MVGREGWACIDIKGSIECDRDGWCASCGGELTPRDDAFLTEAGEGVHCGPCAVREAVENIGYKTGKGRIEEIRLAGHPLEDELRMMVDINGGPMKAGTVRTKHRGDAIERVIACRSGLQVSVKLPKFYGQTCAPGTEEWAWDVQFRYIDDIPESYPVYTVGDDVFMAWDSEFSNREWDN